MPSYGLPPATSSRVRERVRRTDPDRYFCSLFAPPALRERLWLLYAFNHELARASEVTREPVLTLMRLTWWREVVEGAERAHEIAEPLHAALQAGWFRQEALLALIDAREWETEPETADFDGFMNYVRGTAGQLARIAGLALGVDHPAVDDLGTAYGISGILRMAPTRPGKSLLPDDTPPAALIAAARRLLLAKAPRAAQAAVLPAVFARRDLDRPWPRPHHPRGLGDRLAVIRAAVTGF